MQESNLAIADIIYKYLTQQYLNEDETTVLQDWLNGSSERREWFEAIQDGEEWREQLKEFLTAEEKSALYKKYKQRYPEPVAASEKKKRSWKFMVAAASVVIISLAFAFFNQTFRKRTNDISATERTALDIDPGSDKAVLEMSNGQKLVLEAVADGKLQQEGATTIIKTKGLLSYQSNNKNNKSGAIVYNTIRTPRGGQYQVALPDGSKVWLNAGSSLTFPVTFSGTRRVQLRGEGYFEVAHMDKTPFIVSVHPPTGGTEGGRRGAEVEVLGTHFNVCAYDNEETIKTTLQEGKVKVGVLSGDKNEQSKIIAPGQQAAIACEAGKPVAVQVREVDVEQALAWKNNQFAFEHTSITEIANTIQRWYDVDIEVKKGFPQQFNATIPRDITIKKLFRLLEEASDGQVHFRLEGKKVVVY